MDRLTATHKARQAGQRALTIDARTADAKSLDAVREHLTGKAPPRTAEESNHLAALTAKNAQDVARIQAINDANAQRGIKGMLQKLLSDM